MKEEKDETSKAKRTEGVEKFFFPLIGEKARGLDKKDKPNQTTGDRTQGKKKAEIDSDREQQTGKGEVGLETAGHGRGM